MGAKIKGMKFSKQSIYTTLENPHSKYFSIVNDVLAFATIVSIFAIVLETVPSLHKYSLWFLVIEWGTVGLFTLEYILRLWSTKNWRKYAYSFFGAIDLIAILPTFLGSVNLTFLKSARIVRIIRFLRLVRLTKLSRYGTKDIEETVGMFGLNILLYATVLLFVTLGFGVALHVFETGNGQNWSIPAGMFWTFSVFLGGLPAPIPPSTSGTVIFILAKFSGMALFGLLVGVVGKLFNEWILGKGK